jgi:serine/threonine protein kinase
MTTPRDQLELYVMGEHDDPAAVEQALAGDEAARAVLAAEARFETVLRDAAAAAAFCPGCGDLVRGERCDACGAALEPGGYTVERVLVANAHGRMYAARDTDGRQVALKELAFVQSPTLSAIAAFEREAKVLRALEHPAIPRFVASFEEGTGVHVRYYLAQELVSGQSLDARLEDHWFTEAEIIDLARQVLGVLVYLQSLSPMVIHRDIKPANLIARPDGSTAVVDFGAAHVQGSTAGSTSIGTFGYMPIEQLAGIIDATTDPYALGASLLHLLTRREPWRLLQGTSLEGANLSPALREFLGTLVAPEPRHRFPNAAAALAALEQAAAAKDEAPRSPKPVRARWRRTVFPIGAAALVAAGLGAAGHAYVSSHDASDTSDAPAPMLAPARPEPGSPVAAEPPHNVPPSVFEQFRIHNERLEPDDATRAEIVNAKVAQVVAVFKLCVDATGQVTTVNKLKSTGFAAYDRTIEKELLRRRYRPVEIDGKPSATCTAQTFIFRPEPPRGE